MPGHFMVIALEIVKHKKINVHVLLQRASILALAIPTLVDIRSVEQKISPSIVDVKIIILTLHARVFGTECFILGRAPAVGSKGIGNVKGVEALHREHLRNGIAAAESIEIGRASW